MKKILLFIVFGLLGCVSNESIENTPIEKNTVENSTTKELFHYVRIGDTANVDIILETIDVNIKDSSGNTALFEAVKKRNIEMIKLLLEHGAFTQVQTNEGFTPLMYSVLEDIELTRLLLQPEINYDIKQFNGWTALMYAVQIGNIEAAKLLLLSGAHIDITNNDGCTALMIAVQFKQIDACKLLLSSGANYNMSNYNGKTALSIAKSKRIKEVIHLLIEAGAIDDCNSDEYRKCFETRYIGPGLNEILYYKFEYDHKDKINKIIQIELDGTIINEQIFENKYDENNRVIEVNNSLLENNVEKQSAIIKIEYNDENCIYKRSTYFSEDKLHSYDISEYNDKDQLIRRSLYYKNVDGEYSCTTVYYFEYDNKGNLINEYPDSESSLMYKILYEYDENNNVKRIEYYDNNKLMMYAMPEYEKVCK